MSKKIRLLKLPILLFLLLIFFTACVDVSENAEESGGKKSSSDLKNQDKVERSVELDILCVGDIMVHSPQLKAQQVSGTEEYDFTNNYQYVKPYIEAADLAICNLETTFAGKPYLGYPVFSSPDELADAIKNVGFDVVSTANNHMNDKGSQGIVRTQNILKSRDLPYTGSRLSVNDPRYCMSNVKGVKIATIAYTYETPASNGVALNGIPVANEYQNLINSFSYSNLDSALEEINEVAKEARNAGADIVIMFMHWGEEYQQEPNSYQIKMAQYMATEANVDIIFGSHPHVIQKLDNVDGVPVYYSLGNFISNQRMETLGNSMTEIGMMANVTLSYNKKERSLKVVKATALPTWVERYLNSGKLTYEIIPLDDNLKNNPTLAKTGNLARATSALQKAKPFVGE